MYIEENRNLGYIDWTFELIHRLIAHSKQKLFQKLMTENIKFKCVDKSILLFFKLVKEGGVGTEGMVILCPGGPECHHGPRACRLPQSPQRVRVHGS